MTSNIYINVTSGLVVNEKVIEKRVMEKLPFMATENIMMESVKRGADRQETHEIIREHSHAAAARVKKLGLDNNLIDLLSDDSRIPLDKAEITAQLSPEKYTGRAANQVDKFLAKIANPTVKRLLKESIIAELSV